MEYNEYEKTAYLSRKEREAGLKSYLRHVFLNGVGFSFLTMAIVQLLALHFGAGNIQIGYLGSALHLTGIVMIFVPRLFNGMNIGTLYWRLWFARGMVCLGYFLTIFIAARNREYAVWLILLVYTLYSILRNMAWPLKQAVEGMLTSPATAGRNAGLYKITLDYSRLLSNVLSYIILSLHILVAPYGIFILKGLGVILNTFSALSLRSLPIRETVQNNKRSGMFKMFTTSLRDSESRYVLLLYWLDISLLILTSFNVAFLRRAVEIPTNRIFAFTSIGILGGIIASRIVYTIVDRSGSKPILILLHILYCLTSVFWFIMPTNKGIVIYFVAGFFMMSLQGVNTLVVQRLLLRTMPVQNKVTFTSMANLVMAFIAMIVGIGTGAVTEAMANCLFHEYSAVYLIMFLLSAGSLVTAVLLKEKGCMNFKNFLQLLISPNDFKALQKVSKIDAIPEIKKKKMLLLTMVHSTSNLVTSEFRHQLKTPMIREREELLRSLFFHPRIELEDLVIEEALNMDSWWQQTAIFALGTLKTKATEAALLQLKNNPELPLYLQSVVVKSLARHGNQIAYQEALDIFHNENACLRSLVNSVIAISYIDKEGKYLRHLSDFILRKKGRNFREHLYIIIDHRFPDEEHAEEIYFAENNKRGDGLNYLLADAIEYKTFASMQKTLQEMYRDHCHADIMMWVQCQLENIDPEQLSENYRNLREGLLNFPVHKANCIDALAALYFLYHIYNSHSL